MSHRCFHRSLDFSQFRGNLITVAHPREPEARYKSSNTGPPKMRSTAARKNLDTDTKFSKKKLWCIRQFESPLQSLNFCHILIGSSAQPCCSQKFPPHRSQQRWAWIKLGRKIILVIHETKTNFSFSSKPKTIPQMDLIEQLYTFLD